MNIKEQIQKYGPNTAQKIAMKEFKEKAKHVGGWRYAKANGVYDDGTIELIFINGRNRYWVRFPVAGEWYFAPTTMVTKNPNGW